MKNKDKFANEIFAIACSGGAIAVSNGKLVNCRSILCMKCDYYLYNCHEMAKEWCEAEYVDPPVDWSKVSIDTKIFVSFDDEEWEPRHFAGCVKDGEVGAWDDGTTSFTSEENYISYWPFAKLSEDKNATD